MDGFAILGIVFGIVVALMLVIATFLLNGRGTFLISGYTTMSADKKAGYEQKALCRFVGWLLVIIALCMALFPIGVYFEATWLIFCSIAILSVAIIFAVIYANTGNRFRKNDAPGSLTEETSKPPAARFAIVAVVAITAIVLATCGILFHQGNKDPAINTLDNSIQIKGMYGLDIAFSDITDISLIDKSMSEIGYGQRTNAYGGIGNALKGHFKSDSLGKMLLFVQKKTSLTIQIERGDKETVYISLNNRYDTECLYLDLITNIKISSLSPTDLSYAYFVVLLDLYFNHTPYGMNPKNVAVDLTNVKLADTSSLINLLQNHCNKNGVALLQDNFEGLRQSGYIVGSVSENGEPHYHYFKDGFIIVFNDIELNQDTLVTSAYVWYGDLGASGLDYTIRLVNNSWEIAGIDNWWMS